MVYSVCVCLPHNACWLGRGGWRCVWPAAGGGGGRGRAAGPGVRAEAAGLHRRLHPLGELHAPCVESWVRKRSQHLASTFRSRELLELKYCVPCGQVTVVCDNATAYLKN